MESSSFKIDIKVNISSYPVKNTRISPEFIGLFLCIYLTVSDADIK